MGQTETRLVVVWVDVDRPVGRAGGTRLSVVAVLDVECDDTDDTDDLGMV